MKAQTIRDASPRLARKPVLKRFYLFLCICLASGALAFAHSCWRAIHAPYELDYGEGLVMWQTAHVMHWAEAYKPVSRYPYVTFQYTPVYQIVSFLVRPLTGDLLQAGRWVSFLSALGICWLTVCFTWIAIPRRWGREIHWGAALAAGLLCANLPTIAWARLMRVDMLGLAFTFLGLLLFVTARPALEYAACLCFVLALFTKQTLIAAPTACLMMALAADWRRGWRLVAFTCLTGAAALTALVWATHGAALLNLFLYNQNPFSFLNMLGLVQLNLAAVAPVAGAALAVLVGVAARFAGLRPAAMWRQLGLWARGSRSRAALALASLHLVLAMLVSLSCGKKGSNYNYFLEWNITACILAAVVLAWVLWRWKAAWPGPASSAVLLILLLFASNGVFALANGLRPVPPPREAADTARIIELLRRLPGPVYSENMTVLMKAGKEVPAEPGSITALAFTGRWDQSDFLRRIRTGGFQAIIVTTSLDNLNRFTPQVKAAIQEEYRLACVQGEFQIYVPRSASPGICEESNQRVY